MLALAFISDLDALLAEIAEAFLLSRAESLYCNALVSDVLALVSEVLALVADVLASCAFDLLNNAHVRELCVFPVALSASAILSGDVVAVAHTSARLAEVIDTLSLSSACVAEVFASSAFLVAIAACDVAVVAAVVLDNALSFDSLAEFAEAISLAFALDADTSAFPLKALASSAELEALTSDALAALADTAELEALLALASADSQEASE